MNNENWEQVVANDNHRNLGLEWWQLVPLVFLAVFELLYWSLHPSNLGVAMAEVMIGVVLTAVFVTGYRKLGLSQYDVLPITAWKGIVCLGIASGLLAGMFSQLSPTSAYLGMIAWTAIVVYPFAALGKALMKVGQYVIGS